MEKVLRLGHYRVALTLVVLLVGASESRAQTAPIQVPNPGVGDPVTLLGVVAITEGPCAGVFEDGELLAPYLRQARVVIDPKVPEAEGVYVVFRGGGISVNERALETGCALLKNVEGLAREQALREAAARGAARRSRILGASTPSAAGALNWTGAGRKSTETFPTTASEWRVSWSLSPDDPAVGAFLSVNVRRGDGSLVDTIS
jgi:hypothetical protein